MSSSFLIAARWDGSTFVPLIRFRNLCDENYVVGEIYNLEPIEQRSMKSHSHFFASLTDAWRNLRDDVALRYPTVEHLRAAALIHEGFAQSRDIVASSKAEANRIAAFVKPMNEYAVVTVKECVVTIWTARSQSMKAMGKEDFQRSKTAVLEYVSTLIGTSRDELEKQNGDHHGSA
jgi:hypothetical protein